jgi:glycosyltransferase involved in cell wall biosynthesis
VLLTFNEAPNIGRALDKLTWARDVVVVDSGSTDQTLDILARYPNVRRFDRPFDSHHAQWRFATQETGIATDWLLRLDADYQTPPALVAEIAALDPGAPYNAYEAAFDYAMFGRKLVASLYPPKPILLRRGRFSIGDAGHTEGWRVEAPVGRLRARIVHDDRKAMAQWVTAQARYMRRELDKPAQPEGARFADWLRRHPPLAPVAALIYALLVKRLFLSGGAGVAYALQRATAEAIYSLLYLERRLGSDGPPDADPSVARPGPNNAE